MSINGPFDVVYGKNQRPGASGPSPASAKREGRAMLTEVAELLKSIDRRLATIELVLAAPRLAEIVSKPHYSCSETAKLTEMYGVKKSSPFTVRLACGDRIPEAYKPDGSQSWRIPRQAVLRILEEGIPPERRNETGSASDAEPL